MRRRPLTWFFVLLLCATSVFLYIHTRNVLKVKASSVAKISVSAASASQASRNAATNALKYTAALANTNKFAWRLSNTSKTVKELAHDPHAILLENALIDTSAKLNLSIPKNLLSPGDPGAYVVQARGTISPGFRAVLAQAGATVVSYIPNNSYLVRATEAVADGLMGNPFVQAVIPYEPYYKVQAPLLAMADQPLPADVQLNLGLFPGDASTTVQQIQQMGGIVVAEENSLAGYTIVKVEPPQNWTAIAALTGVHIVEPSHRRHLANDLARPMLGVAADSITPTNYMNLYGSNILVDINDGGIDTNHPDFNSTGIGSNSRIFGFGTNTPDDGHGTHVAGIIVGNGQESMTVTNASGSILPGGTGTNSQFRGKAPLALAVSRFFGDDDRTLQETAASQGALISNNSWGFDGDFDYDLEAASFDAATRDSLPFVPGQQSVLYVFSAGNDGTTSGSITSPGTAKDIMTVGALEELRFITNSVTNFDGTMSQPWLGDTDDPKAVADFSSDGNVGIGVEGTFGRFKPDVVAPGTFVVSCRSAFWDTNAYYNPTNDNILDFPDLIPTNSVSVAPFNFFVPSNTVNVIISVVTNMQSPQVLPIMPIYLSTNGSAFSIYGSNNVQVAPDPSVLNSDWTVEASNTATAPIAYDLIVDVQTTNIVGNYYQVLQNMNDTLGTQPEYYRYESGTSMSAASMSGFLALIQDYFTNQFYQPFTPSPALLKAMAINGARSQGTYDFQVDNSINYQGWGLPDLSNSVPPALTNLPTAAQIGTQGPLCSTFFRDEGPTNGLATGDSETFTININTNVNDFAQFVPLRVTVAWTDPPGDPSAAIKLVNDLELVVTDLDNPSIVYYGNDIGAGQTFNTPEVATNPAVIDNINNVQNVFIPPQLDGNYSVTVFGLSVNANAVTEHTNNFVQDFALVISAGDMGEVTDALQVTDGGIVSSPTNFANITYAVTNQILLNQTAGGNTPLLGTNTISMMDNDDGIGTNSEFSAGMTNQWHFYVVTNNTTFTNAAFITFGAVTLAIPRMGVFADSDADATTPTPDLDMLVTRTSTDANAANLLSLDPNEISNCIVGVNGDGASLVTGGTDFVAYTNAVANEVYYIGIKSESHMGIQYGFVPIFTQTPFGGLDQNGNAFVNGLNVPQNIPQGTPSAPGIARVFMINLNPVEMQNVVLTNTILHQNFGDLVGSLTHNNVSVVLNNHDSLGNPPGPYTLIYDDSGQNDIPGSQPSDGPGSLRDYDGTQGQGVWILTEEGTVLAQTGQVQAVSMFLQKHQNLQNGIEAEVQPGEWFYDFIDVPNGYTNLEIFGTNLTSQTVIEPLPIQMYLLDGSPPTFNDFDFMVLLNQGFPLGNEISDGPPLAPGTYWVGLFNPNVIGSVAQNVYLLAVLNGPGTVALPTGFSATNASPISIDAVTNTSIFISNTNLISSLNVGMVVQYPRLSDLAFTLVSPTGQRVLLMENRGGPDATNAGSFYYVTNFIGNFSTNGTGVSQTNYVNLTQPSGQVSITYDFFTRPDEMTVYYGTNVANPGPSGTLTGNELFDSGMIGNFTGNQSVTLSYPPPGFGPIYTNLTIIMNQFGNTNGLNDAWQYSLSGIQTEYNYLTFTGDTNLTTVPIKFAIPPFDLRDLGTNYTFSDFDLATNGDYFGQSNIYDPFGGWVVPTNFVVQFTNGVAFTNNFNEVSILSDPSIAFGSSTNSSNVLALGYGIIQRTNFVTPFRMVTFSYDYRGPGIAGWWRGEGDARDSSDAEAMGQNGSLIGRFDFPVGEVSQAFEMENNGGAYDFAGTNSYVQIRQQPIYTPNGTTNIQSSYLDVGTGSGFTVEGWINPTNTLNQQPLVEWLARVPTNGSDTNLTIRAGPFLYRGKNHYYYMLGPTNWTTSETWAMQLGGHLATVDSADEQNWIFDTFAGYGGRNRNLWIGLTNNVGQGTFDYSSGETNVSYYNWLGMPTNCDLTRNFTFMFGNTNTYPGLWVVANDDGTRCGPISNIVYGVVDVTNLQTNGVSFWISVTNVPGTTNIILTNTGCLFANLVDSSNMSHWIYSQPGLVQSNEFQHVALTYDTNSGIANLFYDGTNVASTNFGVFIPKTTGDVLLGKDMSLETNNYFGGEMDEVSIYNRALSDAEIMGIYSVSAFTTNRLIGKFDPTVTPPLSLAEAQVVLGGMTNTIFGENNTWQEGDFSFTTQTNALPLQIMGIEPGMLFDSFSLSEAPLGNLYYLPEQSLDELNGEDAFGNWTLEIWNTRDNTLVTNAQVISWQLQIILQTNVPPPVSVGAQEPTEVTVFPGQMVSLAITPPLWASVSQNTLLSSTQPLNVYFNQNAPPTGNGFGDVFLFGPGTTGNQTLTAGGGPLNFTPGQTYYIGLQNPGTRAASAVFEVSYNITALTNDVPYNDSLTNDNGSVRYFSFDVTSTNAYEATFQLLNMNGNCDLVVSKAPLLPTLTDSQYGSFNAGRANENIYVLTNSSPVPLTTGTWYLGVYNRDPNTVNYTVLAHELDLGTSASTNITLIQLTNGVPFSYTAGPGAALTNFFSLGVTNLPVLFNGIPVIDGSGVPETNFVGSIHFQLYNLTGNGDLTVQSNAPPFAPPFFQSSQQPGTLPEYIQIETNSVLTNLAATWYLGVPNETTNLIYYTILAVIDTNSAFPTFPGASGAGSGTGGASIRNGFGTNNTVYHVTSLNDDGSPGTLRDAVSSTNRTIVFDVSGVIYLQSPLIITNSYLTIAGQTAPDGGADTNATVTVPNQFVYISDYAAQDIYQFAPNGAISTTATGLNTPAGMAFDSGGDLFVANQGTSQVYEYVNNNGTLSATPTVVNAGTLGSPVSVAFDSANDLFITDQSKNTVVKVTPGGVVDSTFASGLDQPEGITVDGAGNVYVGNQGNDTITEITPAGVKSTYASGNLINDPGLGLAFNSAGELFVGNLDNYGGGENIIEIAPGNVQTVFASGFGIPNQMAFNNAGNLLVALGRSGDVLSFAPNGVSTILGTGANDPNGLAMGLPIPTPGAPTATKGGITLAGQTVAVQGAHDVVMRYLRLLPGFAEPPQNLFIGTYGGENIEEISSNQVYTFYGGLDLPNSVVFDPEGDLFEGDQFSGNIYEFTNYNGTLSTNKILFASGINNPSALAFDKAGNLYVANLDNTILEYTPGGMQSTFATGMYTPQSLAFDRYGNLFVGNCATDANGAGYITKITPAGVQSTFITGINTPGGLAFDAYGNLFVSEGNLTDTILKFTTNGTQSTFANGLNQPTGLAFNNDGSLFVADQGAGAGFGDITVISPSGVKSGGPTGLAKPLSLAFQGQQLPVTAVPPSADTALFLNNASNIVSDHLSIEWSTNNDVLVLNSTNADIQWSIISDSIHATDTLFGAASVVETNGAISLHHNLYADNVYANPRLGGIGNLDFINNVIYNWGTNAGISDNDLQMAYTNYLNYVGNYIIASKVSLTNNVAFWGGTTNTWIFQTNNFIDSDTNFILNGANTRWDMFTNRFTETNEFPLPAVAVDEAYQAYEKVLDFAGDSMFTRDANDTNIVEDVRRQAGVIISQPGSISFFTNTLAYEDTANDGIPDFWKTTFGQILTNAENNNLPDASGYSELEEYENWLAGPHALTITNAPVGINLEKLFGKSGNLSFWLTNAIHGTVYLTNVLGNYTNTSTYSNSIAIFTPTNEVPFTTNYSGLASFDVFVTNNDTIGYFGPVTVNVFVSVVPPTYSQQVGVLLPDPVANNIGANTIQWYKISTPTNILAATNMLLYAGAPVNMWYSSNAPPTAGNSDDFELLTGSTNGTAVINIDGAPLPPRVIPGGTYYLGIQNTNDFTTYYAVGLAFDLAFTNIAIPLGGNSPQTNTVQGNSTVYYAVTVPPNAIAATNILDFATGALELWFNQTVLPIEVNPPDYELLNNFSGTTPGIGNPILATNSTPPLEPGQTYYLAVQNANAGAVQYGIEVDFEYSYSPPVLPIISSNLTVTAGNTLTVDDTATDTNAGVLVYYLTTAPPVNATVNNSGIITWNVPTNEPATNIFFTLIVSNSFTLQTATNSFTVTVLPLLFNGQPQTGTVASNSVDWLAIPVPLSADWATNLLLSSTPLAANVLFTTNSSPTTNGAYTLMFDETSGTSLLGLLTAPTNIVSGGVYYIGIQNTNSVPITYAFQVNFGYYLPPVLPVVPNQVTVPGGSLVVTNTAMDPNLVGTLSYALITSPSVSATISTNGIITWNVPSHQPLGHLLFETIVTNSLTTLSATNYFTVTVVSEPLVFFSSIIHTNIGGTNGFLLSWFAPTNQTFKVQETGSLSTPQLVWGTFTNVITYTGPVTPTNGLFTFFDNGSQFPFGSMRVYRLLILLAVPPNTLTLPNQPNIVAMASQPIIVTNTAVDSDLAAIVTYSLGVFPAPATNAMMTNGIISWTPGPSDAGGEYKFTTVAMDNGLPPATVTNSFTVFVEPPPAMNTISSTSTNVTFQWTAPTNDLFQVEWTTNLNPAIVWHTFPQTISSTSGTFNFTDNNRPAADKFYRLIWQPLP